MKLYTEPKKINLKEKKIFVAQGYIHKSGISKSILHHVDNYLTSR
jgi:hypothetical protein